MRFVLDNFVAMRWLLASEKASDQKYAEEVLLTMADAEVLVPNLWHLEAASVLLGAEKRGDIHFGEIEHFIAQLENLAIHIDTLTHHHALNRTLTLSREYNLSSYDAAYLELAIRERLPLATLDKNLLKAAKKAEVGIYLR